MPLNKAVKQSNDNLLTPYITIASNVTQLGTSVTPPNRGATTAYPTTAAIGDQFYDSTTNELKVYTVNGWVSAGTVPNAPTNVTVLSASVPYGGLPGAIISWAPATTGVPASSYVVTSSVGGFTQTTTGNSVTIYGLSVGTSYTFTVTAKNSFGSSATTSGSLTPVTVPQTPTVGTPTITAAGLSVPVTAGATGGSAITGYTVTSNPGNIPVTSASSPVLVPTVIPITGGSITAGTVYSFTATANNIAGASLPTTASSKELDTPIFVTSGLTANYDFYRGSYGGMNLAYYSEDFSNATYWSKGSTTVATASGITDPFGGTAAYKLISGSGATGRQNILQVAAGVLSNKYEVSIFVKQAERRYVTLWFDNLNLAEGAYYGAGATFDLQTGTYAGGDPGTTNIQAVPFGNGWYRLSVSATLNGANTGVYLNLAIGDPNNVTAPWTNTGDGTSGVYVFGAQIRNLSSSNLATGYVKTTTSQVNYTSGTTIYDLSGNGYNATGSNFTYSNTSTNGYGGLIFNGTTTSVPLPNLGTGVTNYTWSSWSRVNFITYPGNRMLIGGSPGYQYGDASWSASGIGEYYYPHAVSIPNDTWLHTTIVVSNSNTITVYRNGYLEGTFTGTTSTTSFGSVTLATGFGGANSIYTWGGVLGKLSFYIGKALSASEVLQNFNADRVRYGV